MREKTLSEARFIWNLALFVDKFRLIFLFRASDSLLIFQDVKTGVKGRTRGGSKESSSDELVTSVTQSVTGVTRDVTVKEEKVEGVSVRMCEVRVSPLERVKLETGESEAEVKPDLGPEPDISPDMTAAEVRRE